MIIKTITCHDVYNAGASLQAYALYTYLKELGHEVEIIDYKPDYLSNHYSFKAINPAYNKPLLKQLYLVAKFPSRLKAYFSKRKKNFDNFKLEYLHVTEKQYHSNNDLKQNPPRADVYFAGSDQIWNPLFENGKDPVFYLDFAPEKSIRASYAASFAVDKIPDELTDQTKSYLSNFDYISVRESSALEILKSLGFDNCSNVCDPVFLLEKQEWDKLTFKISNDDYLLIYDFDNSDKIRQTALKVAEEQGLKIFSVFKLSYADKCFYDEGPLGFLSLVKNAKFVISNSFHATAFSIIFNVPFCVINRNEGINARMADLLKAFNLSDFNKKLDLNYLNIRIKEYSDNSKNYINSVINSSKRNLK